jgi:uncharacterized repeat protein (TIGR01451 family)
MNRVIVTIASYLFSLAVWADASASLAELALPPVPPGTADLAILPISSVAVTVGTTATLTYTVANLGPADATGSTFTLTLPAGVSLVSAAASQGSVTDSAGTVQAALGTVAVGATATVTCIVSPTQSGSFSWTSTASAATADGVPNNNSFTTMLLATAAAVPPRVQSVVVNDGSAQRSEVRSIAVTFSDAVTFAGGNANAAAAFQLNHIQTGNNVILSATVSTDAQGRTVVTLAFSGAETDPLSAQNGGAPSLADGQYQLTILSSAVTDGSGLPLDGNSDGIAGGDFYKIIGN